MKLTIIILLVSCLQVSAKGFSQERISLKLESVDIKKALAVIERKSDYRFLYNQSLLAGELRISVNADEEPVIQVLDRILANTRVTYELLENKLIVLKEKTSLRNVVTVTGRVTGPNGEPIAGASVRVKGTNQGTATDSDGRFSINAPDNAVLQISYIGFETQEVSVNGRSEINISLSEATRTLEQVVVVGYGTQRKVDVTGAIGQVRGEDISKQPAVNAISNLQGKVAGVQITNSGAPGSSPEIRIRGLGTVYGNPNPLFVVDGVWYDDISWLNPGDIENVSILKDASSQSIYGIRAANGVVLITTRKGRSGRALVTYNGYAGWQKITNPVDMANGAEYAQLINELRGNTGLDPSQFGSGTDWYRQILRNAFTTNHQVSAGGGTEKSTYNFSLGYLRQDGLVKGNTYDRYTARLQTDFQVADPVKIGISLTGAGGGSNDVPGGIFRELFTASPIVPVYYADGSYGDPSDFDLGDGANYNPQATIDFYEQKSRNYRFTGSVYGEVKFARNFTFKTSVGGDFGQNEARNYVPVYTATLKQRNTTSQLSISRSETRNWILENTLTYDVKYGNHSIRALGGQSAQRYKSYSITGTAQNVPYNTDGDLFLRLGSTNGRNVVDNGDLSTITSYFGRINYSFAGRYLLNASFRADGSSKFFGDDRWGYFPSVGVGWVVSDEAFMQGQQFFDILKLRGSWGIIGNATVPSNISVLRVSQDPYLSAIFNNQPATGASITSVVPPTTFWEKGVGTDIGLEAAFFDNKLSIEADVYNRETQDAIFAIPILGSVGTSSGTIIGNQATFRNRGLEFLATWRNSIGKKLTYLVSGNFSYNENEVLSVSTGANPIFGGGGAATGGSLATRTVLGEPIGQFYGLVVDGVFQTTEEVAASAQTTAAPGDFRYRDISGPEGKPDGVIDGSDRVPIGNPNPKFTFGLNTTWTYGPVDLTVDLQGVAGVDIYNANLGLRYGTENYSKEFFDNRWNGQGTSNTYPSASIGGRDNYRPNDFYVEDGSYVRIRNAQIGYTLPGELTQRWKLRKVRVFANAQNALNFFSYRGLSPEVGGTPTNAGIDANVYPLFATYNFGLNVTF